ncbi:hypothetical protein M942_04160 [Enterobacter ludwigii]|nr:hypothetical protein M942_04160 [Enterobacter ludwigii]
MTVAERIDALMPECVQAAIPPGGWMIFSQGKHPGAYF